ncbi:MAG TPA: 3'-5' exonuclease [Bacteroidota bacterium]|nr:3'-5' exonuclease [Bacteroidota bacterium]
MKGKISEVVFDIETFPCAPGSLDESEAPSPGAKQGEDPEEAFRRMSLTPLTARTVSIAMLNPSTHRGKVWYEHPGAAPGETSDGHLEAVPATEEVMLSEFWSAVSHFRRLITFNGRFFDCPFLMLRSALLGVAPSRDLMPYRFSAREHCDLLDQLTFYGAVRKFSLESYCRGFGIGLPSAAGRRPDLSQLLAQGRYGEIAEHAAGTVRATGELYRIWQRSLAFRVD